MCIGCCIALNWKSDHNSEINPAINPHQFFLFWFMGFILKAFCINAPKIIVELLQFKIWIYLYCWHLVVFPFNAEVLSALTNHETHYREKKESKHLLINNNMKRLIEMSSVTMTLSNNVCWWMVPFAYGNEINSTQRVSALDVGRTKPFF